MNTRIPIVGIALALTCCPGLTHAANASSNGKIALKGNQEGTVFRTLTIEGEDRVHLEIARPTLRFDLDPADAPGLDLGSARDVLDRTRPDLTTPLLTAVAHETSGFTGRPWLETMASGPVARFRPDVSNVEAWELRVTDSRGRTAATFEGKGDPPKEITWSGRGEDGSPALPGLVYSYVLEALDQAGNRRHFMGEGFEVPPYRVATKDGPIMVLSGSALSQTRQRQAPHATSPAALEIATWLNQVPIDQSIEIAVVARSHERCTALTQTARAQIEPVLLGDAVRVRERVIVEPEAPVAGALIIRTAPRQ